MFIRLSRIALSALLFLFCSCTRDLPVECFAKVSGRPGDGSREAVVDAADRILSCVYPDGAINMSPNLEHVWINPYFANFASWGLLRAYGVTRDSRYRDAARSWLRWYASHLNPDGTINDYTGGEPPNYIDSGDHDSADSYAAAFIYAVWLEGQVSGDSAFLNEMVPTAHKVLVVLEGLRQEDGLTWAKQAYRMKYFADNVEVWMGLRAAADILRPSDPARSNTCAEWAQQLRDSLHQAMWVPEEGWYRVAEGSPIDKTVYPGAFANLWAVTFLLDPRSSHTRALNDRVHARTFPADGVFRSSDAIQPLWYVLASRRVGAHDQALRAFEAFRMVDQPQHRLVHINAWLIFIETEVSPDAGSDH